MRRFADILDPHRGESPWMREQLRHRGAAGGVSFGFIALVVLRILLTSSAHHVPRRQYVPDLQLPKALTEDGTMVFVVAGLTGIQDGDTWRFDCRDVATSKQIGGGEGQLKLDVTQLKLKVPFGGYSGTATLEFWHEPRRGHCSGRITIH